MNLPSSQKTVAIIPARYSSTRFPGKPLAEITEEYGLRVGFALVIALFLFVTWNDFINLGFINYVSNLFG